MNKKQGDVTIERHLIGNRKPIAMFLGIGAAITLTACDTQKSPYYAFTDKNTCENQFPGQCDAAYKMAENQAQRTAIKYMLESECTQDFGRNICLSDGNGAWYPMLAGIIMSKGFAQPFFTTFNHRQSLFGRAFMADGREIGSLRDMNGANLFLPSPYNKPLASSVVGSTPTNKSNSAYQRCINQLGWRNCDSYRISSGTISSGTFNSNDYKKSPSALENKARSSNYKSTPTKTRKSSGGFGSTGRAYGGFGS